jgi:CheY-like chemotaxis protein
MLLRRLIGEKVKLETVHSRDLWQVKVDVSQFEQVIVNLAVNARDAMPNGGVLTLETCNVDIDEAYAREHVEVTPGSYVVIIVSDTGMGMDAETRARLFEPFYTTKERGEGTGLGLAMVHGVVRQSGGHIYVYSEIGTGTTFRLYFPRTDVRPELDAPGTPAIGPRPRGSETILVVEDDDALRRITVRGISSHGYHVLEANGSDEALSIAKSHPEIALVVTDVIMPGLSGREVMERLRVLNPTVKAIFTSGYTDDAVARHGVLEKGVHFVQKPFSMSVLLKCVRDVLDGVAMV